MQTKKNETKKKSVFQKKLHSDCVLINARFIRVVSVDKKITSDDDLWHGRMKKTTNTKRNNRSKTRAKVKGNHDVPFL